MSSREVVYDEVGSRTRQAWVRTTLGVIALSLLIERGLALAHAPPSLMVAGLLPSAGFVAIAVARMGRIARGRSPVLPRRVAMLLLAALIGVAAVGLAAVVS